MEVVGTRPLGGNSKGDVVLLRSTGGSLSCTNTARSGIKRACEHGAQSGGDVGSPRGCWDAETAAINTADDEDYGLGVDCAQGGGDADALHSVAAWPG